MGAAPDDDGALLRSVADEDADALAALYDRHAGWLHARLARRCGDPDVVREVLQDTFMTVWRSAGSHRGREAGGWLWVIAARTAEDARDRHRPPDGDRPVRGGTRRAGVRGRGPGPRPVRGGGLRGGAPGAHRRRRVAPRSGAAALVCDDGTPQVSAALTDLRTKLRGVPERLVGGPSRQGEDSRWEPGPGGGPGTTGRLADLEPAVVRDRLVDPASYANAVAGELLAADCPARATEGADAERATAVNDAVLQWLAPSPSFAYYGPRAERRFRRIEALTTAERTAYLTEYFAAGPCAPKEVPSP
ncbi:hypothetical protein CP970_14050 [Streptomyces kanamyceticus]|uniref:RNA polymerase sigma-70 region 2 domain-containing protein n=2 Tax=Streptomyces kanamyceticus TaxID=1967 RepID=A0A5J6G8P2_STRKN|nr:hypothetical protein CP970_14050 [Streptomyces kanamyceticus]